MASKVTVLPDPSTGHTNYPPVTGTIAHIAIFPPIGISRVGDSNECFLAPEVPAHTSPPRTPDGKEYMFRDAQQKLRRQAVRFRVYAYDADNKVLGELNAKNGYTLSWSVNVENKKPAGYSHISLTGQYPPTNHNLRNPTVQPNLHPDKRDKLIIKAPEGSISNSTTDFVRLQGEFYGSKPTPTKVDLAQLQLDDASRLVFIPGEGGGRSVADPSNPHIASPYGFDRADWFDEICDGKWRSRSNIPVLGAWVLSGPPNFAWGINMPTTLYDIMEDVYHKATGSTPPTVDFWTHIWPVLQSASLISWTNETARRGHGLDDGGRPRAGHYDANALFDRFKGATTDPEERRKRKDFKTRIFERLRRRLDNNDPDPDQTTSRYMPRLSGNGGRSNAAALTRLQYERFRIWKDNDDFHLTGDGPPVPKFKLEDFQGDDTYKQPEQLARAILESTVGDAFFPGIEMYLIVASRGTYTIPEARIKPPFRINAVILPGYLTQGLSLPWQTDFNMCQSTWWPAVRPDDVVLRSKGSGQDTDEKEDFDVVRNTRVKWRRIPGKPSSTPAEKRALDDTSPTPADTYNGNDDMIKHWAQFGVVREVKSSGKSRFLEDEHVVRT